MKLEGKILDEEFSIPHHTKFVSSEFQFLQQPATKKAPDYQR